MKSKEFYNWLDAKVLDLDEGLKKGFITKEEYEQFRNFIKKWWSE